MAPFIPQVSQWLLKVQQPRDSMTQRGHYTSGGRWYRLRLIAWLYGYRIFSNSSFNGPTASLPSVWASTVGIQGGVRALHTTDLEVGFAAGIFKSAHSFYVLIIECLLFNRVFVSVCVYQVRRGDIWSSGNHMMCILGIELSSPWEHQVVLTAEPSLAP